jgi:hypothetical protein
MEFSADNYGRILITFERQLEHVIKPCSLKGSKFLQAVEYMVPPYNCKIKGLL